MAFWHRWAEGTVLAKLASRIVAVVVGVSAGSWCLYHLIARFDWPTVGRAVLAANLWWFLGACIPAIMTYSLLRSLRLWVLVKGLGGRTRFREVYAFTVVAIALGLVTPGQVGEAAKVEWLHRQGVAGRLPALGMFLLERVLDLLTVIALFAASMVFGGHLPNSGPGMTSALVALAVASAVFMGVLVRFRMPGWLGMKLEPLRVASASGARLAVLVFLSLASWLAVAGGWLAALESVGLSLGLAEGVWVLAISTLAQILSFVPGGVGVAEVVGAELLIKLGHSAPQAQAGALMLRCFALMAVLFGLAHLPFWRRLTRRPPVEAPTSVP